MAIRIGNTIIDGRVLIVLDRRAIMSDREQMMLMKLIDAESRVVTHDEMLACMWGNRSDGIEAKTIDVICYNLRQRLANLGSDIVVETVPWLGRVIHRPVTHHTITVTPSEYEAIRQCVEGFSNRRIADIARAALGGM